MRLMALVGCNGHVPATKVASQRRFDSRAIDKWMKSQGSCGVASPRDTKTVTTA